MKRESNNRKVKIITILLSVIIIVSCDTEHKNDEKDIINSVIPILFDDIFGSDVDSIVYTHYEVYPENAKKIPLKEFIEKK